LTSLSYLTVVMSTLSFIIFFFNDPATTEIYTLSLHDALPILNRAKDLIKGGGGPASSEREYLGARLQALSSLVRDLGLLRSGAEDRKSTRLNSSHVEISYAVFCLKKKKKKKIQMTEKTSDEDK